MTKPTKIEALQTKITGLQATIDKLNAELAELVKAEEATAGERAAREQVEVIGLSPLTKVRFFFGRKDNRKEYTGDVVAFRPAAGELPAAYKIEVGTGFDTDIKTVPARDVQPVQPVALEDAAS